MFNNENINNKSCERDFLNRSLIDNSKSRICYVDLREKYFGNEIEAYKKAKLEQERLEAEKLQKLNSVEEGDMMTNNELEKIVVNAPSSEPVVKLTKEERERLGSMKVWTFDIDGKKEISISGLGFVGITGKGRVTVTTFENISVTMREPLI